MKCGPNQHLILRDFDLQICGGRKRPASDHPDKLIYDHSVEIKRMPVSHFDDRLIDILNTLVLQKSRCFFCQTHIDVSCPFGVNEAMNTSQSFSLTLSCLACHNLRGEDYTQEEFRLIRKCTKNRKHRRVTKGWHKTLLRHTYLLTRYLSPQEKIALANVLGNQWSVQRVERWFANKRASKNQTPPPKKKRLITTPEEHSALEYIYIQRRQPTRQDIQSLQEILSQNWDATRIRKWFNNRRQFFKYPQRS